MVVGHYGYDFGKKYYQFCPRMEEFQAKVDVSQGLVINTDHKMWRQKGNKDFLEYLKIDYPGSTMKFKKIPNEVNYEQARRAQRAQRREGKRVVE